MKNKFAISFLMIYFSIFTFGIMSVSATTYDEYLTYEKLNNEIIITLCDISATEIEIPETIEGLKVTKIGEYAFENCTNLTNIKIPDGVTLIGDYAFEGCESLASIEIPNSVTSIGEGAFKECSNLFQVYVDNLEAYLNCEYVGDYSNFMNCAEILYVNGKILKGNLVIPDGIKIIPECAFKNCIKITSVTLPNSVTTIGGATFRDCTGLTSIEIPNSVTTIGKRAFYNCSGLTSIEIPNSVTTIGKRAFYNCSGLTSIEISNSVTSIGDYAFYDCTSLTSIEIPNSVTMIGDYAFSGCESLTSIEIPNSVTTIGEGAFSYCTSLASIIISDGVTEIEMLTFAQCENLNSINIPVGLTLIGSAAFSMCNNLSNVYYNGTEDEWDDIYIYPVNDCLTNAKRNYIFYVKLIDVDGNEDTITYSLGETIKLSDIEKKYMHEVTLYEDKEMKTEFDLTNTIEKNFELYIKLGDEISVITGDIDGDNEITMDDAIYLFNAVMFSEEYPISESQKTDYNGDGVFDMDDAVYLFNHTMFPEEYPI